MTRVDLYAQIAAVTNAACGQCATRSCCTPEFCARAERHMRATHVEPPPAGEHPTLRFMGPAGCVLAPHLRPECASHCCALASARWRREHRAEVITILQLKAQIRRAVRA